MNHQQEGPPVRARRGASGCRWCSSPRAAAVGPSDADTPRWPVSAVQRSRWLGGCQRPGAAGRRRLRALLRRQRRAARLLRRDHRDARGQYRHGRPGHDRRRRSRRVHRPRTSGRCRSRCRTASSTSSWPTRRRGRRRPAVSVVLPGRPDGRGRAPTSACCAHVVPENRRRVYDIRRSSRCWATTARCWNCGRFGPGMVTAWPASRAGRWA